MVKCIIELDENQEIIFPKKCVFCGKSCQNMEKIKSLKRSIFGWNNLFIDDSELNIPSHYNCINNDNKIKNKKYLVHFFVLIIFLAIWYSIFGEIGRITILISFIPLILIETLILERFLYKSQFSFIRNNWELHFFFSDQLYCNYMKKLNHKSKKRKTILIPRTAIKNKEIVSRFEEII